MPSFGSLFNPVDVTAAIFNDLSMIKPHAATRSSTIRTSIRIAMINASLQGELAANVAREIAAVARQTAKPIFLAWSARDEVAVEAYAMLDAAKLPHYKSPVRCGRALATLSWYAEAVRRAECAARGTGDAIASSGGERDARGQDGRCYRARSEADARLLRHRVTREELATSREQAVAIARRIGYPVALKVQSPDISHKTEAQGGAARARIGRRSRRGV